MTDICSIKSSDSQPLASELQPIEIGHVSQPDLFTVVDMQKRLIQLGAWLFATLIGGTFLTLILSTRPPDFMPFHLGWKLAGAGRISRIHHKPAYQPLINELRATSERMNPVDAHQFIRPAFQAFFHTPFTWYAGEQTHQKFQQASLSGSGHVISAAPGVA